MKKGKAQVANYGIYGPTNAEVLAVGDNARAQKNVVGAKTSSITRPENRKIGPAAAKKIFISYRREDTRYQAQRIYAEFVKYLPSDHVFMDIDSIRLGEDFVNVLKGWIKQSEILLALMGPNWINASDSKTGNRRLDNPNDFVRVEVREALRRGIPVVPVLLDRTPMPEPDQLPEDMRTLVRRQAEFIEFRTFDADLGRLITKLGLEAPP